MFEVVPTVGRMLSRVGSWLWAKLAPVADGVAVGIALDAIRPRREVVRENALLRHQLVVLRRKVPRARLMSLDRLKLILCTAVLPGWQRVVAIVRPETVSCDGIGTDSARSGGAGAIPRVSIAGSLLRPLH